MKSLIERIEKRLFSSLNVCHRLENHCRHRIETKDANGDPNGYLIPLWNKWEDAWVPDQVYLTVVAPHFSKGPHLHLQRRCRFKCVSGNVEIITREMKHPQTLGIYRNQWSGEDHDYALVQVAPKIPVQLVNHEDRPAFVINMPNPAWRPDNTDEWPVEEWRP